MNIRVDPGAPYAKNFRDYVERSGIFLEVVPAEAHWRIGLIERRNAVLRDILERVIDAEAVMTIDDFDSALEACPQFNDILPWTATIHGSVWANP